MSFSFYGSMDTAWIERMTERYNLYMGKVLEEVKYSDFSAEQILDSPNPIISCLIHLIINQLMDNAAIQKLSQALQEKINNHLQKTIFTNCCDSHLQAEYVFNQLREEIYSNLHSINPEEAKNQLQELETLFADYDF